MYCLGIMFVLNTDENLGELKEINKIIVYILFMQFVIYYIDLIKAYLSYDGIIIWEESYIVKKLIHVFILGSFYYMVSKKAKEKEKELDRLQNE